MPAEARSRQDRGFTMIELMVVVVIIGLAAALALPMYADSITKAKKVALSAEGRKIYDAMMAYYADHSSFPPEDDLDVTTLDPLASDGYLSSGRAITSRLVEDQLLLYMAPDIGGADQQFLIVMRLASDPDILVAVVHTDLVDDDGDWVDGVFVIDEEDLEDAPGPDGGDPVEKSGPSLS